MSNEIDDMVTLLDNFNMSMTIYCNDFFAYATSWGFDIYPEELHLLKDLHSKFGVVGVYALFGVHDGLTPIKEVYTETYREAETYVRENNLVKKRFLWDEAKGAKYLEGQSFSHEPFQNAARKLLKNIGAKETDSNIEELFQWFTQGKILS